MSFLRYIHRAYSAVGLWLGRMKDPASTVQALLTIVGLLLAGWWFLQQRANSVRVKTEHFVTQRADIQDSKKLIVGVEVRISNVGSVPVGSGDGSFAEVYSINPPIQKPIAHADVDSFYMQPGESEQAWFRLLEIPDSIKTIKVVSSMRLASGYRWEWRSISDLNAIAPAVDVNRQALDGAKGRAQSAGSKKPAEPVGKP